MIYGEREYIFYHISVVIYGAIEPKWWPFYLIVRHAKQSIKSEQSVTVGPGWDDKDERQGLLSLDFFGLLKAL